MAGLRCARMVADWFDDLRETLETAYIAADNPRAFVWWTDKEIAPLNAGVSIN